MRPLEGLASVFINTFGITQPIDKARRKVAWFIFCLLLLVLLCLIAVALLLSHIL